MIVPNDWDNRRVSSVSEVSLLVNNGHEFANKYTNAIKTRPNLTVSLFYGPIGAIY